MNTKNNFFLNKNQGFFKGFVLLILLLGFVQCQTDEDMNYRVVIENNCDFALKVYYDNQDIEYNDEFSSETTRGAVSIIFPYDRKKIFSKYTSVWVEPVDQSHLKSRKFRSLDDNIWERIIVIDPSDFEHK